MGKRSLGVGAFLERGAWKVRLLCPLVFEHKHEKNPPRTIRRGLAIRRAGCVCVRQSSSLTSKCVELLDEGSGPSPPVTILIAATL